MPRRRIVIANNEVYHVFNRSIARENIFSSKTDLRKALEILQFYRFPQRLRLSKFKALTELQKNDYLSSLIDLLPHVQIYAFAFMPNHYHLLLKQIRENGIVRLIANFQNSYAKVFNLKNERIGGLFQNSFKAKRVENDEQFIHISRYIHLNPVTSYMINFNLLANYPWTSFGAYVNSVRDSYIDIEPIVGLSGSIEKYVNFVADQVNYQRELALIKDLVVE